MEIHLVDGASVTREFVQYSSRRRVPDVDKSVTGSCRHLSTVWTPRNPQQILQCTVHHHHHLKWGFLTGVYIPLGADGPKYGVQDLLCE